MHRGKPPFRFDNICLRADGLLLPRNSWDHFEADGYACFIIDKELRLLKELKKWNKELFGDINVKKYNLLGTISSFLVKGEFVFTREKMQNQICLWLF